MAENHPNLLKNQQENHKFCDLVYETYKLQVRSKWQRGWRGCPWNLPDHYVCLWWLLDRFSPMLSPSFSFQSSGFRFFLLCNWIASGILVLFLPWALEISWIFAVNLARLSVLGSGEQLIRAAIKFFGYFSFFLPVNAGTFYKYPWICQDFRFFVGT